MPPDIIDHIASSYRERVERSHGNPLLDGAQPIDRSSLALLATERAMLGARWLASHIRPDGAFPYFYVPDSDRYVDDQYSEVRHAGTTGSFFQAVELSDDRAIASAADLAARFIVDLTVMLPVDRAAYLYQGVVDLGGQSLALVALLERRRITGDTSLDDLISTMARFLHWLEIPLEPGRYFPAYHHESRRRRMQPNNIYGPGEALLALTRLARQFPDGPHLEFASRAAGYLVQQRADDGKGFALQDHWLAIALSELYPLDPNPDYASVVYHQGDAIIANQHTLGDPEPWLIGAFGRSSHINFTTTATKAEAMLAVWKLAANRQDDVSVALYSESALRMVQFLMRVQFTEENSVQFSRPERVAGAWPQDIANSQIRIDFLQHGLAALSGAATMITEQHATQAPNRATHKSEISTSPECPAVTLLKSTHFDGPNVWFQSPATRFIVRIHDDTLTAGNKSRSALIHLASTLSGFDDEFPRVIPESGRTLSIAGADSLAAAFALLIIELQQRASAPVWQFCTRQLPGDTDIFEIVVQHDMDDECATTASIAISVLNDLIRGYPNPRDPCTDFRSFLSKSRVAAWRHDAILSIVASATRKGIPISRSPFVRTIIELGNGAFRQRFWSLSTSKTSLQGAKLQRNKKLTNQLLQAAGLPVPLCIPAHTAAEAVSAANQIGYPVVVKPLDLNNGRFVFLELKSDDEVATCFPNASSATQSGIALVEEFIPGREYRVLMVGRALAGAFERIPAQVVGDGIRTVRQLIAATNEERRRVSSNAREANELVLNERTIETLKRQEIDLDDVPVKNRAVLLRLRNGRDGGAFVDCTDEVHRDNIEICGQAALTIGLDIAGIDLVMPNISASMLSAGGAIIEVNSGSDFGRHLRPTEGKPRDVGGAVIDMLFPPGTPVRAPIVAVMGDRSTAVAELICHMLTAAGRAAGLATHERVVVNGISLLNSGPHGSSRARTILDNPATEVAIFEVNPEDIIEHGLGFDYCDVAVLTSPFSAPAAGFRSPEEVLIETAGTRGTIVLDADRPELLEAGRQAGGAMLLLSRHPQGAPVREHLEKGGRAVVLTDGTSVEVIQRGSSPVALPLTEAGSDHTGHEQVVILAAVAAGIALDVSIDIIRQSLGSISRH